MQSSYDRSTGKSGFKKSLLATSIALALTACGGSNTSSDGTSSGGSTEDSSSVSSTSLSGTVADGYLVDARVCLDLNTNSVCDPDEPNTLSEEGGAFTLEDVTEEELALYPIIVEIIEGVTWDEDEPGVPITQKYTLSAPPGYDFVSPLTTMVQQDLEENENNEDYDLDDAEAAVQTKIGSNLDLSEDYVEAKGDEDNFSEEEREEFEKLHRIAQVTARVLGDNIDTIEENLDGEEFDFDQIFELVLGKVFEALDEIEGHVDDAGEGDDPFDADLIAAMDELDREIGLDEDLIEEEIAAREAEENAVSADLQTLVTTEGINWFDGDDYDELSIEYGTFRFDLDSDEAVQQSFAYNSEEGAFLEQESGEGEGEYVLTDEGWVFASDNEDVSFNDDSTIDITLEDVPSYSRSLEALQFDVSGLNISATLAQSEESGPWAGVVDPTAQFGEGALAFKLTFTSNTDQYRLWNWDCEDSEALEGQCNYVMIRGNVVTNLDDLIVEDSLEGVDEFSGPAGTVGDIASMPGSDQPDGVVIGGDQYFSIIAQLTEGGNVNFFISEAIGDGASYSEFIGIGEWFDNQVGDVTARILEIPPHVQGMGDFDEDQQFLMFALREGYVRKGDYMPAGMIDHGEVVFNNSAREDIVDQAFDSELFDQLSGWISNDWAGFEDGAIGDGEFIGDPGDSFDEGPVIDPEDSFDMEPVGIPGDGGLEPDPTMPSCDVGLELFEYHLIEQLPPEEFEGDWDACYDAYMYPFEGSTTPLF